MTQQNSFVLRSDLPNVLALNIEPEGVLVQLRQGEEVSVKDVYTEEPVTIKLSSCEGVPTLSIWPGDGEVRVEKSGVDVLDLVQEDCNWGPAGSAASHS